MIFSDELLFVHVGKTGGSSVSRYLLDVLGDRAWCSFPAGHRIDLPAGATRITGISHETLAEARVILEGLGRRLDSLPLILSGIRDPYELELSRYAFLRQDLERYNQGLPQAVALLGDFELFALLTRPHGQRPIEAYFVLDGVVPPNVRVIRLENAEAELGLALEEIGIDATGRQLGHANRSVPEKVASFYTAAAERAVYEKYKWAFDTGFYPRLRSSPGLAPSRYEETGAIDRLREQITIDAEAAPNRLSRVNAWLAVAEIDRQLVRPVARRVALEHAFEHASQGRASRLVDLIAQEIAACLSLGGPETVAAGISGCDRLLETSAGWLGQGAAKLARAELLGAAGRFAEARSTLDSVRGQSPAFALGAASAAVSVELLAGDADTAERLSRRSRPWNQTDFVADRADALCRLNRHAEADPLTTFAERIAPADDVHAQARWRRTRAKLLAADGQTVRALELAASAVGLLESCDAPNLHADALVDLAQIQRAAGDELGSAANLGHALRLYERKGNAVSAGHTAGLLRTA